MTKRTIVIELDVESDDGPAAFDYYVDSAGELLGQGVIQGVLCEHVEDRHPITSAVVGSRAFLAPQQGGDQ